jgi:hypothetical protein
MIPKIIHQTWKDKNLPPIIYKLVSENIGFLKSQGYEYMFWTDDMILKLIAEEYPNFYNIYKLARTGVQKGDIARIILVYHYGGIYIDLDVLVLRNFEEILDMRNSNKLYITYEPSGQTNALYNSDKYLCNAFFAANKNNSMLKVILNNIPEYINNYTENIFQKFDIFGGSYFKAIIEDPANAIFKSDVYIIDDRELFYPINDLKFDNMPFTVGDWGMVKRGEYHKDTIMVHYWIHGDFESKALLTAFTPENNKTIHENMFGFFSKLYPDIAKKIDSNI